MHNISSVQKNHVSDRAVLPLYFCTLIRFSIEVWFKTKVLAEKWSHPLSKKNSHSFSDWTAHFLTNNVYTFSQTVKTGLATLRPTRVYYAFHIRHVHVCKIFEVLFRVFESQPVNLFHSSRTLSKTVNSYVRRIDFNWTLWSDCM